MVLYPRFWTIIFLMWGPAWANHCEHEGSTLWCQGRGIRDIPVGMDVQNATAMDLSQNEISALRRDSLSGYRRIQHLNLSNNRIRAIEAGTFGQLPGLLSLNLSQNELRDLPSSLVQANRHLRGLILYGNDFGRMPAEEPFLSSSSLEMLDLSSCRLRNITAANLRLLPRLAYLDLRGNRLKYISPQTFASNSPQIQVNLLYNTWACDCRTVQLFDQLVAGGVFTADEPIQCTRERKHHLVLYTKGKGGNADICPRELVRPQLNATKRVPDYDGEYLVVVVKKRDVITVCALAMLLVVAGLLLALKMRPCRSTYTKVGNDV